MTSTDDMTTDMQQEHHQVVTKHRIRGALWGLLLGLSIAIYTVLFSIIAFGDWLPLIGCVLVGVIVGVLWASFAPPKRTKKPLPESEDAIAEPAVDDSAHFGDTGVDDGGDIGGHDGGATDGNDGAGGGGDGGSDGGD